MCRYVFLFLLLVQQPVVTNFDILNPKVLNLYENTCAPIHLLDFAIDTGRLEKNTKNMFKKNDLVSNRQLNVCNRN